MTRTALTLTLLTALALCATATAGGPTISAGYGCAVACIERAVVTPTASSATVEIETSVPASVTVKVATLDAQLGIAAGPAPKDIVVPPFQTLRTVLVPGLEPATTYRIVVSARDLQGRVHSRAGTFTTREVKVAMPSPTGNLSAGLGCKADCLEKGTLTGDPDVPGRALLELRSTVPATFQVTLVVKTSSGETLHFRQHVTGSRKTVHTATLDGLLTGTTYRVTAKATDASGRSWSEQGAFRTRSAVALVTYHKLLVTNDGDKVGQGELAFDFFAGGQLVRSFGFRRLGSGDTFTPRMSGTTRPGIWKEVSIDGTDRLELRVGGVECDWQRLSRCPRESGGSDHTSRATTTVDLPDAFASDDALPPGYGGGLPAGHDAYAIFETDGGEGRFRVYATVDVRVV